MQIWVVENVKNSVKNGQSVTFFKKALLGKIVVVKRVKNGVVSKVQNLSHPDLTVASAKGEKSAVFCNKRCRQFDSPKIQISVVYRLQKMAVFDHVASTRNRVCSS